jgi:hypothetical protein
MPQQATLYSDRRYWPYKRVKGEKMKMKCDRCGVKTSRDDGSILYKLRDHKEESWPWVCKACENEFLVLHDNVLDAFVNKKGVFISH